MANKQIRLNQIQQDGATSNQVIKWNGSAWAPAADDGGGGVSDGDKGDIVVSSGGTVWTIDPNFGAVVNNGNSFGGTMTIGTNDNNSLVFETNLLSAATIDTSGVLTLKRETASTNVPVSRLVLNNSSSGTVAANFGSAMLFQAESSTTENQDIAAVAGSWSVHTHASRRGYLKFYVVNDAQTLVEAARIEARNTNVPAIEIPSVGGNYATYTKYTQGGIGTNSGFIITSGNTVESPSTYAYQALLGSDLASNFYFLSVPTTPHTGLLGLAENGLSYTSTAGIPMRIASSSTVSTPLRLFSGSTTNYVGLKAADTSIPAAYTITLPSAAPGNNTFLGHTNSDTYEWTTPSFISLTDTPASYSSANNKLISVNSAANAVQFIDGLTVNGDTLTFTSALDTDLIIQSTGDLEGNSGSPTPRITFRTTNANTATLSGDLIYRFGFDGRKATVQTGFLPTIVAFASNTWTDTDIKHSVVFYNGNSNPNHLGTGTVNEVFGFTSTGDIRTYWNGGLYLDSSNLSNGVTLKANATTASYTITLPSAAPSSNTYLKYNGSAYVWDTAGGSSDTLALTAAPGSDHSANGITITLTANEAQAFGDAVYINADGEAQLGDADSITTAYCIGICTQTVSANNPATYLLQGIARDDTWAWTVGQPVYLSTNGGTGSTLTQTAPSGTGDVVQLIGIATHTDRMYVNPQLIQLQLT